MRTTYSLFLLVIFALLLSGCGGASGEKETPDRTNSGLATAIASPLTVTPAPTATPAPAASVLRTERLEIVDKEGRVRALLTTLEDTRPTLALLDKSGEFRAWLFDLFDRERSVTVEQLVVKNGLPVRMTVAGGARVG